MYSNLYFIKWLLEHAWNSVRGKCHQFLYRFLWKSVYYCTDWSFSPQLIVHSWNILGQEITGPRVKIYPIWFCISTSSNARWQGVAVFIEVEKIGKTRLWEITAVLIPNATKWECGKVWSIPRKWKILGEMRYENSKEELPSASPLQLAKGKRRN